MSTEYDYNSSDYRSNKTFAFIIVGVIAALMLIGLAVFISLHK